MSYSKKFALALTLSTASCAYAQIDTNAQADVVPKPAADKSVEDLIQRKRKASAV